MKSRGGKISGKVHKIEVTDTCTREEMIQQIMRDMCDYVCDGIKASEIYSILECDYGIAPGHCYDLVQKLMIEMNMYCPDREHLYYVK